MLITERTSIVHSKLAGSLIVTLVDAAQAVIENSRTYGKTYYLAGAEVLSYYSMIERIFIGIDQKPRIISLPQSLFRVALKLAAAFGSFSYTPDMADRMNQNLNYDIAMAEADFAYKPQAFLTEPQRDLPVDIT